MVNENIVEAIKKARESKKRNFKQSFDLAINLKSIDLKKPDNKIKTEVVLPNGIGRSLKIGFIADSLFSQVKDFENVIAIRKDQLEFYGKNKKETKRLANQCYSFLAEAPLMPLVGKNLGQVLAVRNKMPKPIPPTANVKPLLDSISKTIKLTVKDSPVLHCIIGTEDMPDDKIAENIDTVIKVVIAALPKGKEQVKNAYVKLTMGKPAKVNL
jgi:large subunit ribosomal protein L1